MNLFTEPIDEIQVAFEEFHRAHPQVWQMFVRFTWEAKDAGLDRYSADAILHRIRWFVNVENRDDEFKINNNFASRYARMLMEHYTGWDGFFQTRVLNVEKTEGKLG